MKKLTLILLLLIICQIDGFSQKYKDIFPQIISANEENAFDMLNAFWVDNMDHPNTNLRLALIYVHRYKATDPLREQEKSLALAEQAKNKLLKASLVIDSKEVSKNEEYYVGLVTDGAVPSFEDLQQLIKTETDEVDNFLLSVPPIYKEFTKSVENYDKAVKDFAEIMGTYTSLNELYLLYNTGVEDKLQTLKTKYDSTKIYFDQYLSLRKKYRINFVDQSYIEKPIKVYRLDGLVTQINFLQPKIELWDYTSWVDSVNNVVAQDIAALRKELVNNEKKLQSAISELNASSKPETFVVVHPDKKLIYELMKYDYKNAIVPLLEYQEFEQQFTLDQNRQVYFDTAAISVERKLAYFNDIMYSAKHGDSIIMRFEDRYNPIQLRRHEEFINQTFGSPELMRSYMAKQKEDNSAVFHAQVKKIKEEILNIKSLDSIGNTIKYKRSIISLHKIDDTVELPLGQIRTTYILTSPDESIYIAGRQVTDSKILNNEIALAKLSADLKPIWLQNFDIEIDSAGVDANHWLGDIKLTTEGIAFVIHSVSLDSSKSINTIIHLTDGGETKFIERVATDLYPRELNYIETTNMFTLVFMGTEKEKDTSEATDLAVVAINGLGESLWKYENQFNGDYRGMITSPSSLLLAGNYTVIKNKAGRTITVKDGTNGYIISLSLAGELNALKCLQSDTPYSLNQVFKVNDRNINLLGSGQEHIILNSNLEIIYSSITLK